LAQKLLDLKRRRQSILKDQGQRCAISQDSGGNRHGISPRRRQNMATLIATRRQIIAARTRQHPIKEFNMSLSAIPTSLSAALPAANFHPRGHHRGAHADTGITGSGAGIGSGAIGSVGQLPVGATTGLFSNLLQSLEQVVGAQSSASTGATSSSTAAATAVSGANAATSSVSAAFNQWVNGVNGGAALSSSQSANSTLQNFLNTLLQNLQANGVQSASPLGAAVNARV